jgi:hypothetical protein
VGRIQRALECGGIFGHGVSSRAETLDIDFV